VKTAKSCWSKPSSCQIGRVGIFNINLNYHDF
jgi:hypothetical protein